MSDILDKSELKFLAGSVLFGILVIGMLVFGHVQETKYKYECQATADQEQGE